MNEKYILYKINFDKRSLEHFYELCNGEKIIMCGDIMVTLEKHIKVFDDEGIYIVEIPEFHSFEGIISSRYINFRNRKTSSFLYVNYKLNIIVHQTLRKVVHICDEYIIEYNNDECKYYVVGDKNNILDLKGDLGFIYEHKAYCYNPMEEKAIIVDLSEQLPLYPAK